MEQPQKKPDECQPETSEAEKPKPFRLVLSATISNPRSIGSATALAGIVSTLAWLAWQIFRSLYGDGGSE